MTPLPPNLIDEDSYPTEEYLDWLRTVHCLIPEDREEVLQTLATTWAHPDSATKEGDVWTFVTGGWSGNEDMIAAWKSNIIGGAYCWLASYRGGRHEFTARPDR